MGVTGPAPTPQELQDIIQALRLLVQGERDLECRTTDAFLLRFIKASRYDVQTSFYLVKEYFRAKIENPEAFIVQSPAKNLKTLQRLDLGYPLVNCDKKGRRVLLTRFGDVDPSRECWTNITQTMMMIFEGLSLQPDVQDRGVALILDCTNFTLKIMKWATPHKMRTLMRFFQDCIPLRVETIHLVQAPFLFNIFYTALKPFMNEEFKRKLCWHHDSSSLEEYIEQRSLPTHLGGAMKPTDSTGWHQIILDREDDFAGTILDYNTFFGGMDEINIKELSAMNTISGEHHHYVHPLT